MEDKRKEELKTKTDKIHALDTEIDFYEKIIEETTNMLEFLDVVQPHHISLTGYSDDEGHREDVLIELYGSDLEEVVELIKKKLRSRIRERNDRISKAYQELDELLK
nr:MAG TPA: hypothetical protein [Caudoviricetes sp.]